MQIYNYDDYERMKSFYESLPEDDPMKKDAKMLIDFIEFFKEYSMFDIASATLTALQTICNPEEFDFILGFWSSMEELKESLYGIDEKPDSLYDEEGGVDYEE